MDEGRDGSQRGASLQHAAVTVVYSCGTKVQSVEVSSLMQTCSTFVKTETFSHLICI